MVAREFSKQPPWSIAMSTSTEPGRMDSTISAVTSFGAAAPGISTEPITRSASATVSPMFRWDEASVRIRPWWTASSCASRSREMSRTVTSAPMPAAITAAASPATPPPITATRARRVPGTPPISTPEPPCGWRRW